MEEMAVRAQGLKQFFLAAVDRDTAAFNQVMAALRLPKKSEADKAHRAGQIAAATREATMVPLSVLEQAAEAADLARLAVRTGNRNSLSDAGVAGLAAAMAGLGALYNVMINLGQIDDPAFTAEARRRAVELHDRIEVAVNEVKLDLNRLLVGVTATGD
jgi:glutamate formiminotransferase/formiminotetrahydrofolate cyclodeaminase